MPRAVSVKATNGEIWPFFKVRDIKQNHIIGDRVSDNMTDWEKAMVIGNSLIAKVYFICSQQNLWLNVSCSQIGFCKCIAFMVIRHKHQR